MHESWSKRTDREKFDFLGIYASATRLLASSTPRLQLSLFPRHSLVVLYLAHSNSSASYLFLVNAKRRSGDTRNLRQLNNRKSRNASASDEGHQVLHTASYSTPCRALNPSLALSQRFQQERVSFATTETLSFRRANGLESSFPRPMARTTALSKEFSTSAAPRTVEFSFDRVKSSR